MIVASGETGITGDFDSPISGSNPDSRATGEGVRGSLSRVAGPPRVNLTCSRCDYKGKTVQIQTWCSVCGPTPLCIRCNNAHWEDTEGGTVLL